ncbi:hypothetical protein EDB87DRAFT_1579717 [Lactarius vividus]|nr:hypothetical protein EDB87DRAFT_1579717 [Lactarius vividus]
MPVPTTYRTQSTSVLYSLRPLTLGTVSGPHFTLFVLLSGFATVVVAHDFDKVTQKIAIDTDLVVAYLFVTWLNPEGVGLNWVTEYGGCILMFSVVPQGDVSA